MKESSLEGLWNFFNVWDFVMMCSFKGLRKRIATLFLQYCRTPLFNAEAAKHIKVSGCATGHA